MDIFVIREGKLRLNSDEILTIKPFAEIYERDKSIDKHRAFKEFNYLYQLCDYKSLPNQEGFRDKDAKSYAIEVADLELDFKPDNLILKAIEVYKKNRYNVLRESVLQLKKSFKTIINVVASAQKRLETNLADDNANNETVTASIEIISKLLSLSNSLNTQIKLLGETLKQIDKEEQEEKEGKIRGDKNYTSSLDGDPDIED